MVKTMFSGPYGFMILLGMAALTVPLLAIFLDYLKRSAVINNLHKERLAAIEKGLDLSQFPSMDSVLVNPQGFRARRTPLYKGILWTLLGIALAVVLAVREDKETAVFGLLPGAIGIANLIYHFAVVRKELAKQQQWPAQSPPQPKEPPMSPPSAKSETVV